MPRKQFNALDYGDPMVVRILDAGEQCINRFGIRRSSMGEVARVGKLSRGSIYRHFSDKEALVEGIFRRRQEAFLNRAEARLEQETTLVDKLVHSVLSGRKDMQEGLFASLAEIEPETVAMMFLDPRFYQRSVSFWPPHVRMAQASGGR
jgi:AcrR family transcriptional regulator